MAIDPVTGGIIGAGVSGLAAALGGGGGGSAPGSNFWAEGNNTDFRKETLRTKMEQALNAMNPDIGKDPTQQILENPLLGQFYGKDSPLSRLLEQDKAMGLKLNEDDMTAFGQAAADIARQTDQGEASLANALAMRGMDTSGAAALAFAGSQGNKREQIAKAQRQIMQDKFNRALELKQMAMDAGQQVNQAINSQHDRQIRQTDFANNTYDNIYNKAKGWLGSMQDQWNIGHAQQQQAAPSSSFGSVLSGALGGAMSGGRLAGALSNNANQQKLWDAQTDYYRSATQNANPLMNARIGSPSVEYKTLA